MRYTNGTTIIEVSKSVYHLTYKPQGYVPVDEPCSVIDIDAILAELEVYRSMVRARNGDVEILTTHADFVNKFSTEGFVDINANVEQTEKPLRGLPDLSFSELKALAKDKQIDHYSKMSKEELIIALQPQEGQNVGGDVDEREPNNGANENAGEAKTQS